MDLYSFNGEIKSYYQCYQKLVQSGTIKAEEQISQQVLVLIKDFEENLKCVGFCHTPRFWFFKNFYEGPPKKNCISSLKDQFKKADGFLGYSFICMASFSLLQLLSICGICKSTDKCFLEEIEDQSSNDVVYLDKEYDDISNMMADQSTSGAGRVGHYTSTAIEMPERAQRFQIRQRNYEID